MNKKQLVSSISKWLAISRIVTSIFMVGAFIIYIFIDYYVSFKVNREIDAYIKETGVTAQKIGMTLPIGYKIASETLLDTDLVDAVIDDTGKNIWAADSSGVIHLIDIERKEIVRSVGEGSLSSPNGIFWDGNHLSVVDYPDKILFMTPTGEITKIVTVGEGEFQLLKVVKGVNQKLYILGRVKNTEGIWTIAADNDQPRLWFSVSGQLDIYSKGDYLYSTGSLVSDRPLAKISTYGINEFSSVDTGRLWALPHWDQGFVGIDVDQRQNISLLDKTGNIFLLSEEGYVLSEYRPEGTQLGTPKALLSNPEGDLYVIYDKGISHLQILPVGQWINEGIRLMGLGEYVQAVTIWNQVLKAEPYSFAARCHLAESYYQHGDYIQAAREFKLVGDERRLNEAVGEYSMILRRKNLAAPSLAFLILWFVTVVINLVWKGVKSYLDYET
jgi:tetratricopeptide (TPR) repeat protein